MSVLLRLILACCLLLQPPGGVCVWQSAGPVQPCCCGTPDGADEPACACCAVSKPAPTAPAPRAPEPERVFAATPPVGVAMVLPEPVRRPGAPVRPMVRALADPPVQALLCVWLV